MNQKQLRKHYILVREALEENDMAGGGIIYLSNLGRVKYFMTAFRKYDIKKLPSQDIPEEFRGKIALKFTKLEQEVQA